MQAKKNGESQKSCPNRPPKNTWPIDRVRSRLCRVRNVVITVRVGCGFLALGAVVCALWSAPFTVVAAHPNLEAAKKIPDPNVQAKWAYSGLGAAGLRPS